MVDMDYLCAIQDTILYSTECTSLCGHYHVGIDDVSTMPGKHPWQTSSAFCLFIHPNRVPMCSTNPWICAAAQRAPAAWAPPARAHDFARTLPNGKTPTQLPVAPGMHTTYSTSAPRPASGAARNGAAHNASLVEVPFSVDPSTWSLPSSAGSNNMGSGPLSPDAFPVRTPCPQFAPVYAVYMHPHCQ